MNRGRTLPERGLKKAQSRAEGGESLEASSSIIQRLLSASCGGMGDFPVSVFGGVGGNPPVMIERVAGESWWEINENSPLP